MARAADGVCERYRGRVFIKGPAGMKFDEAARWLAAISGSHEVVREGNRGIVVVRVASASKGECIRRMTVDTILSQELARRRAFAWGTSNCAARSATRRPQSRLLRRRSRLVLHGPLHLRVSVKGTALAQLARAVSVKKS